MTYRGDKMRERKNEKARTGVGHDEHGARWRSSEITGGGNGKMRPYLDSKCLAKGWILKRGTRQSYRNDRLENGAATAVLRGGEACGGNGELDVAFGDARASEGEEMSEREQTHASW